MTEEIKKDETIVEQSTEEVKKEIPTLSKMEEQALAMGWKPRSEFDGSDDDFIDAKEFVRRKPLFDRMEQQGKQLKNLTKTLEQLKSHYTKVREAEFNRALSELKAARTQAITDSDGSRFEVIDDRIKEVEKEAAQVLQENYEVKVETPDPAEFQEWRGKNSWYLKDEAMTAFADRVGLRYQEAHARGEITPLQILHKVEQAVRTEFPHKFRNPNKEQAPNVSEGKQSSSNKSKDLVLDETETKIMNNLVRQKLMTKEQYLADLRLAKGIV